MRIRYLLALALLATVANAKEPKHYQSGKLIKMQSVKCGTDAKDAKSTPPPPTPSRFRLNFGLKPRFTSNAQLSGNHESGEESGGGMPSGHPPPSRARSRS